MSREFLPAFVLALGLAAPALAQAPDAAQLAAGQALFDQNCSVCHLSTGAGGVHLGSAVSADLRAPGLEQTYKQSDDLLRRAILHARDQDDEPLDMPMPAWAGRLTTAQVDDIIAYLKTLKS